MEYDYTIDLGDMCCQGPILKMTTEFKQMESGKVVLIYAQRDSMKSDVPAFCRMQQHELLAEDEVDGVYRFWVRLH